MFVLAVCTHMHVSAPVLRIIYISIILSTPLLCTFCGDSWSWAWEATHLKMVVCRAVLHVLVRLVLQHGMMTRRIQTLIDSQQWRLSQQGDTVEKPGGI